MKQARLLLIASPEAHGSLSLVWKLRGIVSHWKWPTLTPDCLSLHPDCPSKALPDPLLGVVGQCPSSLGNLARELPTSSSLFQVMWIFPWEPSLGQDPSPGAEEGVRPQGPIWNLELILRLS